MSQNTHKAHRACQQLKRRKWKWIGHTVHRAPSISLDKLWIEALKADGDMVYLCRLGDVPTWHRSRKRKIRKKNKKKHKKYRKGRRSQMRSSRSQKQTRCKFIDTLCPTWRQVFTSGGSNHILHDFFPQWWSLKTLKWLPMILSSRVEYNLFIN